MSQAAARHRDPYRKASDEPFVKAARSLAIIHALIEYLARTVHRSHSFLTLFILVILRLARRPTCVFRLSILRRRLRRLIILCGRWNNQGQDKRECQRQCSDHDGLPHLVDRSLCLMRTRSSERESRQAHRLGVQASAGLKPERREACLSRRHR